MFFAGSIGRMLGRAPLRARIGLGRRRGGAGGLGGFDTALLGLHFAARGREFAFDRLQAAAFGEPARRASRCVSGGGKAVPAPKVALSRNQPLAGLEHRCKARTIAPLDHADLSQAAREFRRRLHVL